MILKAKKAADHMEFGAFISREIRLLKIDRAMFREECGRGWKSVFLSHESVLSWGHKKGLHNYEIDYYEHILSAFSKFTTPENARRIYLEGVKILFPKLKEWFFSTAHCEGKTHFLSKYLVFWRVIRNFASHLSITMAFVFPAKCGRGESVAYLSGRKNFIIIPSWFLFPIKSQAWSYN